MLFIEQFVGVAAVVLVTAVWAVVGLALWCPLLVRAMVVFCYEVAYAQIANDTTTLPRASQNLNRAVSFYGRGFSMLRLQRSIATADVTEPADPDRFIRELVIMVAFWVAVVVLSSRGCGM